MPILTNKHPIELYEAIGTRYAKIDDPKDIIYLEIRHHHRLDDSHNILYTKTLNGIILTAAQSALPLETHHAIFRDSDTGTV